MLKVLFVTPEASPFAQSCGLADMISALPLELRDNDLDVRVIMPKYTSIPAAYKKQMKPVIETTVNVSWRQQFCGVHRLDYNGLPVYFIDNEQYFGRDNLYCYPDDAERFVFFCRAVLNILPQIDFIPDVIQSFDWQTGMLNVIFKNEHINDPRYSSIKTMYTIRHLDEQGIFSPEITDDVLGLSWNLFTNGQIEFDGKINFLKAGIVFADKLLLLSDANAKFINEPEQHPLTAIIGSRSKDIWTAMPGINYDIYNPKTDKLIFNNYDANNLNRKKENKIKLQQLLNLPQNYHIPMLALVSRLTSEKGLDLLSHIIKEIVVKNNIQLVVLGTGDTHYEEMFKKLAELYPNKVAVKIAFDTELAHKIYAASDLLLMPSTYDITTISQLIALRYGVIPISRRSDKTIQTSFANKRKRTPTAVTFQNYSATDLLKAVKQAITLYHKPDWDKTVSNAMNINSSWKKQVAKNRHIYSDLFSK